MRLRNKGTTLLELTMTTGLLSVIFAMALPAVSGYSHQTRTHRAIGDISRMSMQIYRWRSINGDGTYPSSLAQAGIGATTDPWGNPYVYLRRDDALSHAALTDPHGNALNADFDLFSKGADGLTGISVRDPVSADDIVRAADGAYVGIAAEY